MLSLVGLSQLRVRTPGIDYRDGTGSASARADVAIHPSETNRESSLIQALWHLYFADGEVSYIKSALLTASGTCGRSLEFS